MKTAKTLRCKQVVIDSPLHSLLVPKPRPSQFSATHCVFWRQKKRKMEGGSAATTNGNEDSAKKGLDGTGLDLPLNRHGNLKSASSDQSLKDILLQIKSSKTPVITQWCFFIFWVVFVFEIIFACLVFMFWLASVYWFFEW